MAVVAFASGDQNLAIGKQSCGVQPPTRGQVGSRGEDAGGGIIEFGVQNARTSAVCSAASRDQDLAVIKQSCRML